MSEDEIQDLAFKEFERKERQLREERSQLCIQEILVEAERQADSIIKKMDINPLSDTLYRPVIPSRPIFVKTDSSLINSKGSVKPLIDSL